MLGQPVSMLLPRVVGFRLEGELAEGSTATDLVLTVTQMLRERGVVGSFVEFFGPGLANLPLADRATIGNMSPEFGATCAIFPVDAETLRYLEFRAARRSGSSWWRPTPGSRASSTTRAPRRPTYSDTLELDLSTVEPSLAGPKRPQDRVALSGRREGLPRRAGRPGRTGRAATTAATVPGTRFPPATRRRRWPARTGEDDGEPAHQHGAVATEEVATLECPRELDGHGVRAGGRRGRDRRDHELHEHLKPVGDARRRAARQEGRGARAAAQAVGQDEPRARVEGGHRLPRPLRPDRAARAARLQPRRLRLHHLHRQLRAAAGARSRRRSRRRT